MCPNIKINFENKALRWSSTVIANCLSSRYIELYKQANTRTTKNTKKSRRLCPNRPIRRRRLRGCMQRIWGRSDVVCGWRLSRRWRRIRAPSFRSTPWNCPVTSRGRSSCQRSACRTNRSLNPSGTVGRFVWCPDLPAAGTLHVVGSAPASMFVPLNAGGAKLFGTVLNDGWKCCEENLALSRTLTSVV